MMTLFDAPVIRPAIPKHFVYVLQEDGSGVRLDLRDGSITAFPGSKEKAHD